MILTGLPSEVSKTPAPGHAEFWRGLAAVYCPFLGMSSNFHLRDYGPGRKDLTRAANSHYAVTPGGVSVRISADDTAGFGTLSGHGITKSFTEIVVIYHAEGSAFSPQWPEFRNVNYSSDSDGNQLWGVEQDTDRLWLRTWTGSDWIDINGSATLPFRQPFAAAFRLDEIAGTRHLFLDGQPDASDSNVLANSLSATTFSFHQVSATGEWSPYHVLAHYVWNVAKSDAFIRRYSQDWAGPFRRVRRVTWFVPTAPVSFVAYPRPRGANAGMLAMAGGMQ